jgi:hypothetical protein
VALGLDSRIEHMSRPSDGATEAKVGDFWMKLVLGAGVLGGEKIFASENAAGRDRWMEVMTVCRHARLVFLSPVPSI